MINIYNFFFRKSVENSDFLVFFRISIGLLILIHFLSLGTDFEYLYGINKTLPSDIQTYELRTSNIYYYDDIILSITELFNISVIYSEIIFRIIYSILCVFIISGFFSRISAFLLLFLQIGLIKSSYFYTYGVDFFCSMSLFYILLFPSDDYYSIRRKIFKKPYKTTDLTPFRRLFQIQICFAYFMSGAEKLSGFNWRNGEAVWKAFHLPGFQNPFIDLVNYLGNYPAIFVIIGWVIIIIELFYPLFVNIKKTKKMWVFMTIMMHFGIALILNLYFFSAIMIVWNLTNFYFEDKKEQ